MKKIISLLATVAMISTLFVSVVKADFQPTVTSEVTPLTNEDFQASFEMDIPEGYNAYLLDVSFSNLGDLDCTISKIGSKHSGRKLQGFGFNIDFDDISNVETDMTMSLENAFGANLSEGYDGNRLTSILNAGSAADAYPKTATTISDATGIPSAVTYLVLTKSSAKVTATLSANMKVITYSNNTPGQEEDVDFATMSPASVQFGAAAPVEPTPVYTDSSIDVKKPVSGTTGLTDLQGQDVTLTANYGIAKFSTAIDTVANDYFVVATDSNDVEKVFDVDFGAKGVEISNASTTFFAIVKSADHIIKNIRLKEVAK